MIINNRILDRLLTKVQKPARYIGGEYNSIVKDWHAIDVKIALAFPDIYDLGMSNLGLAILYDIVNKEDDFLAERVFVPWFDMEEVMRSENIPLFSLETQHEIRDFDMIGISLPYEQLYSNVLTLLDLGNMPLKSESRDTSYPLIFAGGSAVFNPEPMADFIDFFVIGEGEEVLLEIAHLYQKICHLDRDSQLRQLAKIHGIYVPRFYVPTYHPQDGTLIKIEPTVEEAQPHVTKRIVPVLPKPVTKFIVPFIDIVFNRASIEIQRGCTRGCRFCSAGIISRPVRERPWQELLETVDKIVKDTGHEDIGLLSLSSSDYSQVRTLVKAITKTYTDNILTISMPSLRIESFSADLAEMLSKGRKSNFTFAPESGTDRMRNVINKGISDEDLLETVDDIYKRGWQLIKLYFMIGQPTETDEDVIAIAELAKQVLKIGRKYHGHKAKVRMGVSTFVPKPHTPFQWASFCSLEEIEHKQELIRQELGRMRGIIFNWNNPEGSLLEASLTRGDRRLGIVIQRAWEKGAKFDAWNNRFNAVAWREAYEECELSFNWYAHRVRLMDEVFPWDHIKSGVEKQWLLLDWQASQQGEVKIDCRERCYNCGIITTFKELRADIPAIAWKCPPTRRGL
ncbi:MAG: B12-binding domain-containing radical SAM protein [Anaerolineaceae bacterium 4572_78]|nr:MAG: B12-binding domain-containing radical SAM protein [Anaerolineaceae bacterium 4572_78]